MHSQSFSDVVFSHYISEYSQGDQTLLLFVPSGQHSTMANNVAILVIRKLFKWLLKGVALFLGHILVIRKQCKWLLKGVTLFFGHILVFYIPPLRVNI